MGVNNITTFKATPAKSFGNVDAVKIYDLNNKERSYAMKNSSGSRKYAQMLPSMMRTAFRPNHTKNQSNSTTISNVKYYGSGARAGDGIEGIKIAFTYPPHGWESDVPAAGSLESNSESLHSTTNAPGAVEIFLSLEKNTISGTLVSINRNSKKDFNKLHETSFKNTIVWPLLPPQQPSVEPLSSNKANTPIGVEVKKQTTITSLNTDNDEYSLSEEEIQEKPSMLVSSRNSKKPILGRFSASYRHFFYPDIKIYLRGLAHGPLKRKSRRHRREDIVSCGNRFDTRRFFQGTSQTREPKFGFIFTGQAIQWSRMGKDLLETYPEAIQEVKNLDSVLKSCEDPPHWNLYDELIKPQGSENIQLPEILLSCLTAIQLVTLSLLKTSGIECLAVVGHSLGEVAAAVAAKRLTPEQAIKIAYYRGKATPRTTHSNPTGMMAVGLSSDKIRPYIENTSIEISSFDGPHNVTLCGNKSELVEVMKELRGNSYSAQLLVDTLYNTRPVVADAIRYMDYLDKCVQWPSKEQDEQRGIMYSSVVNKPLINELRSSYWVKNMMCPVLFNQALQRMIREAGVDYLVNIGPSSALSDPISYVTKATPFSIGHHVSAWSLSGCVEAGKFNT
ncbi:hypothetical protein M434DRAFT_101524 [Hypoxylon sp. CO27-5]|nr:hypothetical protein M434DRAFT_101524 [Hypoxylon sp. CO27-5]